MSVNIAMTIEGTTLAPQTISSSLADVIANAQDIPFTGTLTSSFAEYSPPNSNCSRLLLIPAWNGTNDITFGGASGDTGVDLGSLWEFAFIPCKGTSNVYLKCASNTNAPTLVGVWL